MRIIDDDEVDLNEKSENTRYIKRPNSNETRSTCECGQTKHNYNGRYFQLYSIFGNLTDRLGNGQVRQSK